MTSGTATVGDKQLFFNKKKLPLLTATKYFTGRSPVGGRNGLIPVGVLWEVGMA